MQQMWGLFRTLQTMLITSLIVFMRPVILTLFFTESVKFAGADIFSAGDFFEENLKFVSTDPLNSAFDFYGIGNMIMLIQSGSFFVLFTSMLLRIFVCYIINLFATYFPKIVASDSLE